jgi:hypothetical protein
VKRLAVTLSSMMLAATVASAGETLHFRTDVLPVLTKAGCNAGACHGAATGQGGFGLSLLGYDPEGDHERITRALGGRRIESTDAAKSLLLRKAAEEVEHEGGRKLPSGSASHELLRRWIAAGAPFGPRDLQVTSIEVDPPDILLDDTHQTRQLRVTASHSDGSRRDVTGLALFTSNNDAIAQVSKSGAVTTIGRGLTSIMVRYSGQVAAARIAVPLADAPIGADDFPEANFIDHHIRAELVRLRVPASPLSSDAEFLRRVHLDVTGRLPTPEVARAFFAEAPSAEKRQRVIEDLLQSDAFVDFWTMKLADLLLLNGSGDPARAYHRWLREQVATNTPFDQIARALLTASGDPARIGPANFFALAIDPRDLSEHVGRIFLGTQIACARCHAHPSDRWTQEDYHRFAAYFARITRDGGTVQMSDHGEVNDPKTGEPLEPRPLGAARRPTPELADRRLELAEWIASPANPLFARTFANRIWKHLLGRGLVEPGDDLRPTNPPVNPALLDALAADLAAHGFDLRHAIRTIVSSRTYQLTSRSRGGNRVDTRLYSRAYLKELAAPVFADAIAQVTGVPDVFAGYPAGTRAVQLISPATPSPALDVLGRCDRKTSCDGPASAGGGLAQALHLINGSTINEKLRGGALDELKGRPDREVVEELYLRTFTRLPEPAERAEWEATLTRGTDRTETLQDLLWTLLNSREFSLNR